MHVAGSVLILAAFLFSLSIREIEVAIFNSILDFCGTTTVVLLTFITLVLNVVIEFWQYSGLFPKPCPR